MKSQSSLFQITAIVLISSLVLLGLGARGVVVGADKPGDDNPGGKKLPEGVTPLTKEQLVEKVPNFYVFEYKAEPQPGKRLWLRVNDQTWIERYPDGTDAKFNVVGHATVEGQEGTIVVKIDGDEKKTDTDNHGGFQCFIPDKGNKAMHHLYRNLSRGDEGWSDLGEMKSVE